MATDDLSRYAERAGRSACGLCHACFSALASDDWCPTCRTFRRYYEHGYGHAVGQVGGDCLSSSSATPTPR